MSYQNCQPVLSPVAQIAMGRPPPAAADPAGQYLPNAEIAVNPTHLPGTVALAIDGGHVLIDRR